MTIIVLRTFLSKDLPQLVLLFSEPYVAKWNPDPGSRAARPGAPGATRETAETSSAPGLLWTLTMTDSSGPCQYSTPKAGRRRLAIAPVGGDRPRSGDRGGARPHPPRRDELGLQPCSARPRRRGSPQPDVSPSSSSAITNHSRHGAPCAGLVVGLDEGPPARRMTDPTARQGAVIARQATSRPCFA